MISTMLVALIVLGTFSAFDSAGRASADERAHAQATVLAQDDEERLRGLTAAELGKLGTVTRTVTEGTTTSKTTFTITSSAKYVAGETESFTCETTSGSAPLQTISSVTWPALGSRPPVTQSSLVNAPAGAGVLVKVVNQKGEGLEGVTTTLNGGTPQTTPASGCVVYGGLAAGSYKVAIPNTPYVDRQAKSPPPESTVTVAGTALAKTEFQLGAPGTIVAEFENKGTSVTGDTFIALNTKVAEPDLFNGGSAAAGVYAASATLKGLFPFEAASPYIVFAGDCEANNPEVIASPNPVVGGVKEVTDRKVSLPPNGIEKVKVEEPAVNITVYEGTSAAKGSLVTSATSAKMFNTECKGVNSQNFAPVNYEHKLTLEVAGHIVQKYQPYAKKLEFCVVAFKSPNYYKYRTPEASAFSNLAKAGTVEKVIYLKEVTAGYSKSTTKLEC